MIGVYVLTGSVMRSVDRRSGSFGSSAGHYRYYRDPDERSRTSCLPDPAPEAGASSSSGQQERHQTRAGAGPLLPQDHQEAGPER